MLLNAYDTRRSARLARKKIPLMKKRKSVKILFGICAFLFPGATAELPYNPTRILHSSVHQKLVYLFKPSSAGQGGFELGSINISSSFESSQIPYTTLDASLPFLNGESDETFSPAVGNDGNIILYSGRCSEGVQGSGLWKYTVTDGLNDGRGEWTEQSSSPASSATVGANFLATAISFSTEVASNISSSLYIFGGMCPTGENATVESWQSAANYTDGMAAVLPTTSDKSDTAYTIGEVSKRGPPVPEAGYSLCALEPTYSNGTDGVQTQQQSFVVIGGHTQNAFINTSTVALFSLPQNTWSFLEVQQPDGQHTDLTIRTDVTEIEPRSGHTAVLSNDGSTIIVFGGWVGDVNTPASPQLAILNVGSGYGGQGAWSWTAPSASGVGPSEGGIYGHGAVMLPGNIMMVSGGYAMTSSSSRHRNRAELATSTQNYFYNITSNGWTTSYVPPVRTPSETPSSSASTSGPLSTASQKAGLGIGVALGAVAVIGLIFFYLCVLGKRRRNEREGRLSGLSSSSLHVAPRGLYGNGGQITDEYSWDEEGGVRNGGPDSSAAGWKRAHGREAERTGLLVEIPSPTRGLRRNLSNRPHSLMVPRFEELHMTRSAGIIHPIDERDEDEVGYPSPSHQAEVGPEMAQVEGKDNNGNPTFLFGKAGPLSSHPVKGHSPVSSIRRAMGPSPGRQSAMYSSSWIDDYEKEVAIGAYSSSSSGGRISPTKSDRTQSNLSDRSMRSILSIQSSRSGGYSNLSRGHSIRSTGRPSAPVDPFLTPEGSPTKEKDTLLDRNCSFKSNRPNTGSDGHAESFTTARSSFAKLQAEGEALLGGRPEGNNTGVPQHSGNIELMDIGDEIEPNTTRESTRSWIGSVRRAISRPRGHGRTNTITSTSTSLFGGESPEHRYSGVPPSPTDVNLALSSHKPPKRSVSDASIIPGPKRGARDWGFNREEEQKWRRNSGDDWGSPEDRERERQRNRELEEEWDVEAAAEGRDVQVAFTVPKGKLRIVNIEPDMTSLISVASRERLKEEKERTPVQEDVVEETGSKGKERAE